MTNIDVLVVGHRGWPTRFPDNTLAGFLAAADVADTVELDVRRSADGKLVLSHDPTLGGMEVSGTPWSHLAEVDLGDGHHPILLDEALATLPDTPAQIEIKNTWGDPGFEPDHRLGLEAASRSRQGDIVTSFNHETVAAVAREFPDVATGLIVGPGIDVDEAVKHCLDAGHVALVPHFSLIDRPLNAAIGVYPWTVNDPNVAIELVDAGVTGIITDDPGLIATSIREPQ